MVDEVGMPRGAYWTNGWGDDIARTHEGRRPVGEVELEERRDAMFGRRRVGIQSREGIACSLER